MLPASVLDQNNNKNVAYESLTIYVMKAKTLQFENLLGKRPCYPDGPLSLQWQSCCVIFLSPELFPMAAEVSRSLAHYVMHTACPPKAKADITNQSSISFMLN